MAERPGTPGAPGAASHPAPELTSRERGGLAAWVAPAPPAGFADRVIAARSVAAPPPAGRVDRRRRRRRVAVVVGVAAACVLGTVALWPRAGRHVPATGAAIVVERRAIPIGGSVAVAEPGAELTWRVDGAGHARVEQGVGDVFYRVDHGGPFVVATPLGEVRVTGTCFRIEVIMKPRREIVIGGAVGAALAAAVVVTVYEGGIVVAGDHGSARLGAGQRATLTADGPPVVAGGVPAGELGPPAAAATRDQLLARDELQRARIAALTARVGDLERRLGAGDGAGGGGGDPSAGEPWNQPSLETLQAWAKECRVRFDLPPVMQPEPPTLAARDAAELGVADDEIATINELLVEVHRTWLERIRAIYVEVTGDVAGADALSPQAMAQEIEDKSPRAESAAIQRRIAEERAGLVPAPADWSKASPIERYFRSLAALGDETERLFATRLGPERARALRQEDGGWPVKMQIAGCDDGRGN